MKPKRLTDRSSRMDARRTRDAQWQFMERVAREGIVWMCPWDKYRRHGKDGVYVFGLLGCNELFHWIDSQKRCARSIRITKKGITALANRHIYDMELIYGGMAEPGFVVMPWPRSKKP